MTISLAAKSIGELAPLVQSKEVSPVEIMTAVIKEIKNKNEVIQAYIRIDDNEAMAQAKQAEAEIMKGEYKGSLHGIPMALKDIFYFKNKNVTVGSKIHENFISAYDATVVKKLKQQGVVFTGTLNMHEYAYGVTTSNSHYGICRNPWDTNKIPGGSSGGSAAAVSANMTIASIGTETGGSLRAPAAFCGLVSLKPTYGTISKYGCFPLARTLDHVGPITKTVYDTELLFKTLAGYDRLDPDSVRMPSTGARGKFEGRMKDLIIGVDEAHFFSDVDNEIVAKVKRVIRSLANMGAKTEAIHFDSFNDTVETYAKTVTAEASVVHERNLLVRPQDYGSDVRERLESGTRISAVDYIKAQQKREKIRQEFKGILEKVDVLIAPTVPFTAPEIGKKDVWVNGEKVTIYGAGSRLIRPATLVGFPAITIPCGLSKGMPVGVQLMAAPFQEEKLFTVANVVEAMEL
ncbi:amidase [Virgibacillus sp. W0430]|uniref:amidase n=1 Tax=Virgibacillus sp. W0430 TaxID=3391580 RepID=UPI003F4773C9